MGYYAEQPYAGHGYMTEGLRLVLRHTFMTMKLHRVERTSSRRTSRQIALVKSAGFRSRALAALSKDSGRCATTSGGR